MIFNKKIRDLPNRKNYKSIRQVEGLSSEEKYCITQKDGKKFLLIINDRSMYTNKQDEAEWREGLYKQELPTNKLVEQGICNKGKQTYQIYSWIEGKSLKEILTNKTKEEQYQIGRKAGLLLKKIHNSDICIDEIPTMSIQDKIERAMGKYYDVQCNENVLEKSAQFFFDFVQRNKNVVFHTQRKVLHGDFHVGNLIYDEYRNLSVIDWVWRAIGDPWEDFVRIFVSAELSPDFARGQIDAYFDEEPPSEFWNMLALYTAIHELEIMDWNFISPVQGISFAEYQHKIVLEQYKGMKSVIPLFYTKRI